MNDTSWTLGVLLGVPVMALIIGALLAVLVAAHFRADRNSRYGWSDHKLITVWGSGVTAVLLLATLVALFPWSTQYHQWRPVDGTVSTIDHRLIGSGKGMEDKFVVRFEGSTQQYGCDDTRCASVREGDLLALSCKRVWQFTGTDGYDCRFFSTEPAKVGA